MKGMRSFGVWLKTALEENRITQRELAKTIGITEAAVSRYINGDREPGWKALHKIMDYFNVHMVFDRNDDPVITNTANGIASRSIVLRQLLFYMTEGETIQICDGHDGWDKFTEFSATSKLLEPFKDRRIICMGAEETENGAVFRVEIAD